jgi:hypothetical protein
MERKSRVFRTPWSEQMNRQENMSSSEVFLTAILWMSRVVLGRRLMRLEDVGEMG